MHEKKYAHEFWWISINERKTLPGASGLKGKLKKQITLGQIFFSIQISTVMGVQWRGSRRPINPKKREMKSGCSHELSRKYNSICGPHKTLKGYQEMGAAARLVTRLKQLNLIAFVGPRVRPFKWFRRDLEFLVESDLQNSIDRS